MFENCSIMTNKSMVSKEYNIHAFVMLFTFNNYIMVNILHYFIVKFTFKLTKNIGAYMYEYFFFTMSTASHT